MRRLGFILLFAFICSSLSAQSDSTFRKYPFLKLDSNLVYNDSVALHSFFEKLKSREGCDSAVISVVHIGDSHIQADYFSGMIRVLLQRKFGNAGRGLIFPYRAAKSNEPSTYKSSTKNEWKYKRNVFPEKPLATGVTGFTIETDDTSAAITIKLKNIDSLNYAAKELTLFHGKGPDGFDFGIYDTSGTQLAYINTNENKEQFTSTVQLKKTTNQFVLKACPRDSSQNCATIYGLTTNNQQPGILYHTIGVNGAEYRHYSYSEYFMLQLPVLKPDLIILSMGTNEGLRGNMTPEVFYAEMDSMIKSIKNNNPDAHFIITTPSDSFKRTRKGKVKNAQIKEIRNVIIQYCNDKNLAYWDLFTVMGGYGSMAKWYIAKLTAKDKLHFSRKGYELQGELFYNALMKSYNKKLIVK